MENLTYRGLNIFPPSYSKKSADRWLLALVQQRNSDRYTISLVLLAFTHGSKLAAEAPGVTHRFWRVAECATLKYATLA